MNLLSGGAAVGGWVWALAPMIEGPIPSGSTFSAIIAACRRRKSSPVLIRSPSDPRQLEEGRQEGADQEATPGGLGSKEEAETANRWGDGTLFHNKVLSYGRYER